MVGVFVGVFWTPLNAIFAALSKALLFVLGEMVGAPVEATAGRGLTGVVVEDLGDPFALGVGAGEAFFTAGEDDKDLVAVLEGGREGVLGVPFVRMEAAEAGRLIVGR